MGLPPLCARWLPTPWRFATALLTSTARTTASTVEASLQSADKKLLGNLLASRRRSPASIRLADGRSLTLSMTRRVPELNRAPPEAPLGPADRAARRDDLHRAPAISRQAAH